MVEDLWRERGAEIWRRRALTATSRTFYGKFVDELGIVSSERFAGLRRKDRIGQL